MMGCSLVLPSGERVRIISQKHFGFGVVVIVRQTKNRIKREFSLK